MIRIVRLGISLELLHHLLNLPSDVEIITVTSGEHSKTFDLLLMGNCFADNATRVKAIMKKTEATIEVDKWEVVS
jgi:hypothetical protein